MLESREAITVEGIVSDRVVATLAECAADYPDYIREIKFVGGPFVYAMLILGPWNLCATFKFMDTYDPFLRGMCENAVEAFRNRINEEYWANWTPPRML